MPAFSFEALDAQGQTRKGTLEADNARAARSQLRSQALVPLQVEPVAAGRGRTGASGWLTRPVFNSTSLAVWTRQLSGLVSSGLPIERALAALAEAPALARAVARLPRLVLRGLMCIPDPAVPAEELARQFAGLQQIHARLEADGLMLDTLSMGMSADLESAIAHGSTCVRVGTAIFGARHYPVA